MRNESNLTPALSNHLLKAELISSIVVYFYTVTFYKIDPSYGEKNNISCCFPIFIFSIKNI